MATVRCAALYRVSTPRQAQARTEEDESLPLQRLAVRRFVEQHPGWELVREFAEEGVSAFKRSSAERDILQDVLRAAAQGAFTVLLVFKADRLSRQAMEYPFILSALHRAGVRVIAVADAAGGRELAVDGQYDKLLRFLEGWQAETESVNTAIRVSARMRQLAEQGQWTGGRAPYGYRFDPARRPVPLTLDPEEAHWLRQAFAWYLDEQVGTPTIAARLNSLGYRQRNGRPWTDAQLRRAMQNPIVTGRLAYGRTYTEGRKRRQRGAHDFTDVILSNPIPDLVLISQERWEAAMDRMAHYNARRARHLPRHSRADAGPLLLTGIARCAHCGGPLVGTKVYTTKPHKALGQKRYFHQAYLCQTKATRGTGACDGQRTYSAKRVERTVLAALQHTLGQLDTAALVAEVRRQAQDRLASRQDREGALRRALAEAERLKAAWLERLDQHLLHPERSLYSEAVLAEKVREAEARVAAARAELEQLAAEAQDLEAQRASLDRFLATLPDWWRRFLAAPRSRQKALLRHLLERVVVGRDGIDLHYRVDLAALTGQGAALAWRDRARWPAQA
ncbi:MAG: recombinase family protein [Firmicutes bacterium]|nr:recombinase family protein [Bacillota bacterium]